MSDAPQTSDDPPRGDVPRTSDDRQRGDVPQTSDDPPRGDVPQTSDDWDDLADWWTDLVAADPTQSADTLDLLGALSDGTGGRTLDLGCGEGQAMRVLGGTVIGVDLSATLLRRAGEVGPVVRSRLPELGWVRTDGVDRIVAVGIVDLLVDDATLFAETARAVRPGGHLLVVMNHPVCTAPHSEPLVDPDGEILWKWGDYLRVGSWPQSAAGRTVDLVHRPLGHLLTAAADAGWRLERIIERGPSDEAIAQLPGFAGQGHIPSMLGVRWSR